MTPIKSQYLLGAKTLSQGHADRIHGQLPGMPPGTEFYNKAEMQVCGMHRKWLSGIDYVPATQSSDGESIARAIVSSGG